MCTYMYIYIYMCVCVSVYHPQATSPKKLVPRLHHRGAHRDIAGLQLQLAKSREEVLGVRPAALVAASLRQAVSMGDW